MRHRKRFGQNFLRDEQIIDRIFSAVDVKQREFFLEIGPGSGALTSQFYAVPNLRYSAIEIDRDLSVGLRRQFPALDLISDDVLSLDLNVILSEGDNWRILGNLPYNITTPIFFKFAECCGGSTIRDLHFMVQKEMAERLVSEPGSKNWGRLSVIMQIYFDLEHLFDVSPKSFSPEPKVWSSFVKLVPKELSLGSGQMKMLDSLLRYAFSGRRKKVLNSLKSFDINWSIVDIDPSERADSLSTSDYLRLVNYLDGGE